MFQYFQPRIWFSGALWHVSPDRATASTEDLQVGASGDAQRCAATPALPPLSAPRVRESPWTYARCFPKGTRQIVDNVGGKTPIFPERISRKCRLEIVVSRSQSAQKLCGHQNCKRKKIAGARHREEASRWILRR